MNAQSNPTCLRAVGEWLETVFISLKIILATCIQYIKRRLPGHIDPRVVTVTRVIAIDESINLFQHVKWDPEVLTGSGWEHATGITNQGRMEIRLVHMYQKRRLVLYPGDKLDVTFPKTHLSRNIVMDARLVPRPDTDAAPVDILRRVQKYHGLSHLKCASHLFPYDDPDQLGERFSHVVSMDMFFKRHHLPFHMTERKNGSDRSECDDD